MFHFLKKILFPACLPVLTSFFVPVHTTHFVKNRVNTSDGFAVVELFTSEGCSSCPPADEAVGRLKGWKKNVFILCFHVDYWNSLGWKDIFSNAAYSGRQQEYGNIFHLSSIYTPQVIINGKTQFTGSEENRLRSEIEESLKEIPENEIKLKVHTETNHQISVSTESSAKTDLTLNLALVQNQATDFVQRGENKGKTLNHSYIVRDFKVSKNKDITNSFLSIPTGLKNTDCSVIAFLQNSKNGHIVAAAGSSIP